MKKLLLSLVLFGCGGVCPVPSPDDAGTDAGAAGSLCDCADVGQTSGELTCQRRCNQTQISTEDGGTVETYCLVQCVGPHCCTWSTP